MEEAETLADRVGLLADGSLVALDSPAALVREHGGDSLLYVDGEFTDAVTGTLPHEATLDGDRLTVRNVAPADIGGIVDRLEAAGVSYESLTWTEPDLEDVYLELAGRRIDAGEAGADVAGESSTAAATVGRGERS